MNDQHQRLARKLDYRLTTIRKSIADLQEIMENFEGAHAYIAYRLLKLAYDETGNIDPEDIIEIARANAN